MPRFSSVVALAAALSLVAAAPRAQSLELDVGPSGPESSPLSLPTADLLAMTGAGVAASGAVVVLAYEADATGLLAAAPFAAAAAVFGTGEALGHDGSLLATTAAAGIGGLFGLAAASRADAAGATVQRTIFAVVPAVCAVAAFRVGAPDLLRTPTGDTVPGWTVRVGV